MSKLSAYIVLFFLVSIKTDAQVKIITRSDSLLFIGIDNEIKIETGKIPVSQIKLSSSVQGTVTGQNGNYSVRCTSPMTNFLLKAFYKGRLLASKKMNIVRVSDPEVYLSGDTLINNGKISKKHLFSLDSMIIKINVPYIKFSVVSFDFAIKSNETVKDILTNVGQKINKTIKSEIINAVKGDMIIFTNIKCTCPDAVRTIASDIFLEVSD